MAFVNEKIGEFYQTIDKERDITLINLGAAHNHPKRLQLKIKNEVINFEAYVREKFKPNKRYDVDWEVVHLYISSLSHEKQIEIIEIIREALCAYGAFASRDGVDVVQVKFKIPDLPPLVSV